MARPCVTQIHSNFPVDLMIGLRNTFGLMRFIETGTSTGATTAMAALAFPRVDTVEFMGFKVSQSEIRFRGCPHVHCCHADTRDWLPKFDWPDLEPSLIYLDAHAPYNGCPTDVAFPLQEELEIIGGLHGKHCIVVDDNRPETLHVPFECPVKFGTYQFVVLAPGPCGWKTWHLTDYPD